jgi:GntR family transcriptional regulator
VSRALRIDPKDAAPIWRQIEEGVRRLVASGALAPGAVVPSVREMAHDLEVNPNTVVKAYQRLTEAGVLTVKRGEGTFVADAPPSFSSGEKSRLLSDGALRYASLTTTIGATKDEAQRQLSSAFERLDGKKGTHS